MLRRTHPELVDSIDMLRERGLKRWTDVYSQDGDHIGTALRFIHRPVEEVNPEQKLYRTYLVVQTVEFGGPVYIPTTFIDDYDPAANRLSLRASVATLQHESWDREPTFAALGRGVPEELAA